MGESPQYANKPITDFSYYVYMVNKDSIVPAGVGTAHIKVYPSSVTKVRSKFIKNVSV